MCGSWRGAWRTRREQRREEANIAKAGWEDRNKRQKVFDRGRKTVQTRREPVKRGAGCLSASNGLDRSAVLQVIYSRVRIWSNVYHIWSPNIHLVFALNLCYLQPPLGEITSRKHGPDDRDNTSVE